MLKDYDLKNPSEMFAEGFKIDSIDEAYKLQMAVSALRANRGEKSVGYKISLVSKGNQRIVGLNHPTWGKIWNTERYSDGEVLQKTNYSNPSMEAEFAVILNRDLDPQNFDMNYLIDSIKSIHPVIEIHNFIFKGEPPKGHEYIANNAIHEDNKGQGILNFGVNIETDLQLIYDDMVVDSWKNKIWPKDMLNAMEWLINEKAKYGVKLKKGNIILTGSYGPPIPINNFENIKVTSSSFGNVSATFV